MGLQKFKILTANTVVSDANASMETMGTDQLLDLFALSDGGRKAEKGSTSAGSMGAAGSDANGANGSTMKNVLENLPELWDDNQYHEEYDLSQFLEGLKKN